MPAVAQPHRKGFSLIEVATVLGIVGLVVGGIFLAATAVNNNLKIKQEIAGLNTFVTTTRQLYKGFGTDVSTVPHNIFANMPEGWSKAAGSTYLLASPMGYNIRVQIYGSGTAISLIFSNVPSSYCDQILPRMYAFSGFVQFHNQTTNFIDNLPTNRGIGNYCPAAVTTFSLNFNL